jgi:hypothetical protein
VAAQQKEATPSVARLLNQLTRSHLGARLACRAGPPNKAPVSGETLQIQLLCELYDFSINQLLQISVLSGLV